MKIYKGNFALAYKSENFCAYTQKSDFCAYAHFKDEIYAKFYTWGPWFLSRSAWYVCKIAIVYAVTHQPDSLPLGIKMNVLLHTGCDVNPLCWHISVLRTFSHCSLHLWSSLCWENIHKIKCKQMHRHSWYTVHCIHQHFCLLKNPYIICMGFEPGMTHTQECKRSSDWCVFYCCLYRNYIQ